MINNAYLLQPLYTYIFQFKTPVYSFVNVGEKINITIIIIIIFFFNNQELLILTK